MLRVIYAGMLAGLLSGSVFLSGCDSRSTARHMRSADRLAEMGRFEEAVSEYKAALELNPQNAEAHFKLASIYREHLRQRERAIEHFRKVVALEPDRAQAWISLADLHEKRHDIRGAIRTLEESLETRAFEAAPDTKAQMEQWLRVLKASLDEPIPLDFATTQPSLEALPGD